MTRWSNQKTRAVVFCTLLVAVAMPSSSGAPIPPGPSAPAELLPTPEGLAALAAGRCGALLRYDQDVLGEEAGLRWRAEYGRCVLVAVSEARYLDGIRDRCAQQPGTPARGAIDDDLDRDIVECSTGLLVQQGLGAQYSALVEACAVVNIVTPAGCSYETLLDPLGILGPPSPVVEDPCVFPQGGTESTDGGPPPCDPLEEVKRVLCESGICLENLIGVKHFDSILSPLPGCAGVQGSVEVTAQTHGYIGVVHVKFVTLLWWKAGGTVVVDVDVSWSADCEADGELIGYAWGGFMRQLAIDRNGEGGPVCKYDGFQRSDCGTLPGESWREAATFSAAGAYDVDDDEGDPPLNDVTLSVPAGGQWRNQFQGSLGAIELLDSAADALEGERNYVVDYEDDDGFLASLGLGDIAENLL